MMILMPKMGVLGSLFARTVDWICNGHDLSGHDYATYYIRKGQVCKRASESALYLRWYEFLQDGGKGIPRLSTKCTLPEG